jgi:hypothetical protein
MQRVSLYCNTIHNIPDRIKKQDKTPAKLKSLPFSYAIFSMSYAARYIEIVTSEEKQPHMEGW